MSAVRKRKLSHLQTSYMNEYEQQQEIAHAKRKGLIRRLLVFAVFASLVIYGITTTLLNQQETISTKLAQKENLEKELDELKENQVLLEEEIVKLNNDEYLEKIIRRDYLLTKEGEKIFKVPDGS